MILTIIRTSFTPTMTRGLLDVDGQWFCHTLEDPDRKLELDPSLKVPGESAIPRGKYPLTLDFSQRFQRVMPHVLDVPGFEGVRIHNGSYPKDTHGCPLVGYKKIPDGLGHSKLAFADLMKVLLPVYNRKELIWLEIR